MLGRPIDAASDSRRLLRKAIEALLNGLWWAGSRLASASPRAYIAWPVTDAGFGRLGVGFLCRLSASGDFSAMSENDERLFQTPKYLVEQS